MIKNILFYTILVILIMGLYGAGGLVIEEFKTGEGCPKVMHVPMCIVILICFIVSFISHVLKKHTPLYFVFTGLAGCIALIASIMQFTQLTQCPKTASGTPMCYFSLLIFSSLILLKIIQLRLSNGK